MAEQAGQQLERPLPMFPEPDTEPFWAATAGHRLTYQVCLACDQVVFHPRRRCTGCLGGELEWRDSAGLGTVYTFTVIRQNGQPFFRARIPYVVGLIDVDEGFRMLAEIAVDPDSVHVDQRVTVTWEDHSGLSVPLFVPVTGQWRPVGAATPRRAFAHPDGQRGRRSAE